MNFYIKNKLENHNNTKKKKNKLGKEKNYKNII
jgi:hypothetical protein